MFHYYRRNGFVLIELLLVVVIIAILAGGYFAKNSASNSQSMYQNSMSRANDAACKANRVTMLNQIQMFKMNNPNVPVTTENMQKAGYSVATCPQGGAYGFTAEGTIICSRHPDQPKQP